MSSSTMYSVEEEEEEEAETSPSSFVPFNRRFKPSNDADAPSSLAPLTRRLPTSTLANSAPTAWAITRRRRMADLGRENRRLEREGEELCEEILRASPRHAQRLRSLRRMRRVVDRSPVDQFCRIESLSEVSLRLGA
eukprot:TRINITY_DN121_c0_g1_i1.p1 TRINITY_DN121_c0_g1~~TRINITY_DN121_c0_g1_i1.p1  ORF type:complete len:137 (+),score=41.56 TRINITY_DN121_c0_g1_i1:139-549(+)